MGEKIARAATLDPGLYIVATPIGNLADLTYRAQAVLSGADVIACEDSRVTAKLLRHYAIETSMTAYHDHSSPAVRSALLTRLRAGERVALVSDAGTPLIADPGYKLVAEAREAGIPVVPIPGPSALLAALTVSALPTDRFLFAGFPPTKAQKRAAFFAGLAEERATLLFYESPNRLADSLTAMAEAFGDRPACLCRELTKKFEETRAEHLSLLAAHYHEAGPPKGEVVLVVGGAPEQEVGAQQLDRLLGEALETLSPREAAHALAYATGLPRRTVYNRALALAKQGPEP